MLILYIVYLHVIQNNFFHLPHPVKFPLETAFARLGSY